MRRINLYIMGLLLLGMISCTEYLDVKKKSEVIPETAEEFSSLIHYYLRNLDEASDYYVFGEYTKTLSFESYSDNLDGDLSLSSRLQIYVGEDINSMASRYKYIYEKIRDCNIILGEMEDKSSELGKKIAAVAYTLRGMCYYNLMREFCEPFDKAKASGMNGVPLVETFDMEAKPARATLRETFDFIVKDLKTAIDMNQTDKKYRLNVNVAKFYLARTYFWAQEWDLAIPIAKEILEAYPLIKGEAYKEMMKSEVAQAGNELLRAGTSKTKGYTDLSFGYSQTRPVAEDLINLFTEKENDIRYTLFFTNKLLNNKTLRSAIRSAEMCLVIAECYAHLGDNDNALHYLNLLRENRIEPYVAYTMSDLPTVDASARIRVDAMGKALTPLMAAILNERRKELYMENGDRWYELKRNGRPEFWWGVSGVKYETLKFLYTFPIPKADIVLNPSIVQNPEYDKY